MGGGARQRISAPSCNILSKNLGQECSKGSVNTACCLVDSRLINMHYNDQAPPSVCLPFVYSRLINMRYNNQALPSVCLPSVYPMSSHVIKSPRPLPHFCILQAIKNWRQEQAGNKVTLGRANGSITSFPGHMCDTTLLLRHSLIPRGRGRGRAKTTAPGGKNNCTQGLTFKGVQNKLGVHEWLVTRGLYLSSKKAYIYTACCNLASI